MRKTLYRRSRATGSSSCPNYRKASWNRLSYTEILAASRHSLYVSRSAFETRSIKGLRVV
ncbi:unnamed protein product [Ectocarpus sp. CCAP 1310/34]|nr:unnamed protein product [Ectocarpus sp. CCAP 1310/34]